MVSEPITLRFEEMSWYSIFRDCDVLQLRGITNRGTYFAEIEANAKGLREKRERFKTIVIERLSRGEWPDENPNVDLEEVDAE